MCTRLLSATPAEDDPVVLLQAAARDHIPVHPGANRAQGEILSQSDAKGKYKTVPEPDARPSIEEVVEEIEQQEWYKEQVTCKRIFDAKDGQLGMCSSYDLSARHNVDTLITVALLDPPLSDSIVQALRNSRKITSLYTHQVAAITALSQGKNVIVSTSTASGKSVIYQARKSHFVIGVVFLRSLPRSRFCSSLKQIRTRRRSLYIPRR